MSKGVESLKKKDKNIYETFKGSYRVSKWKTFKGFVDIFILFWGFGKTPIFLECIFKTVEVLISAVTLNHLMSQYDSRYQYFNSDKYRELQCIRK
jgi:hypothetical protein